MVKTLIRAMVQVLFLAVSEFPYLIENQKSGMHSVLSFSWNVLQEFVEKKNTSQYTNMQKYCRKLLAVWDNLLVALNHFINTLTLTITLLMYNSQFWCWPCTSLWLLCFYSTFLPNSQPKLGELQLALLRQQMLLKVIVVVTLLSNKRQVRRRQFRQLGVKWLKNAGIKHKREE